MLLPKIVFVAKDQQNSVMKSLSIPFSQFKNWHLEQPWFKANYITAIVLPVRPLACYSISAATHASYPYIGSRRWHAKTGSIDSDVPRRR